MEIKKQMAKITVEEQRKLAEDTINAAKPNNINDVYLAGECFLLLATMEKDAKLKAAASERAQKCFELAFMKVVDIDPWNPAYRYYGTWGPFKIIEFTLTEKKDKLQHILTIPENSKAARLALYPSELVGF